MNNAIKIMIELQKYHDNILNSNNEIDRSNKSISFWEKELSDLKNTIIKLENKIKSLKNNIKQNELHLSEIDIKVNKLNDRKQKVQNNRELDAVINELTTLNKEKGDLEEALIISMDELTDDEKKISDLSEELKDKEKQVVDDVAKLHEKISKIKTIISENKSKFDMLIKELPVSVRSKFERLINAKGGKGVGEVIDNICSNCNFQIPAFLAIDASNNDKIVACTNCGRFIYTS